MAEVPSKSASARGVPINNSNPPAYYGVAHKRIRSRGDDLQTTLEKARVFFHEIESAEERRPEIDGQVRPCVPVSNSPGRKKKQQAHRESEKDKPEPCFCI